MAFDVQEIPFRCPVCKAPLHKIGNSLYCPSKHCFDRAKSSYYNLFLPTKSGQNFHGDNPLMVRARRAFLEKGYYAPLQKAIAETVKDYLKPNGWILDCGSGEGYYTKAIADAIGDKAHLIGIDISKDAIALASKKVKNASFAVASAFHLPLPDESLSMLLQIFSPHCMEEFSRVLQKGGIFIEVFPGKMHLFDFKQAIYDVPYENAPTAFSIEGYTLLKEQHLEDRILLSTKEDIDNLFKMTPYYYKTGQKEQERAKALGSLSMQTDFHILVYQKQ